MSGELKSENINLQKSPTRRSHHPAKDHSTIPSNTMKFQKDISTLYSTILQILESPSDIQRPLNKTLLKTLTDCHSHLNAIMTNDLECSLR
jgi:hypothetical protein